MNSSGCGQDPVPEDSVWTIPAADILTAALQEILWSHQPRTPIAEAQRLVGDYFGDWSVEQLDASTLQARLGVISAFVAKTLAAFASSDLNSKDCGQAHATPLNLTAFPTAAGSAGDTVVLRAHPTGEGAKDGCRWLDDGDDQELMYFEMEEGSAKSKSVEYMGVSAHVMLGCFRLRQSVVS